MKNARRRNRLGLVLLLLLFCLALLFWLRHGKGSRSNFSAVKVQKKAETEQTVPLDDNQHSNKSALALPRVAPQNDDPLAKGDRLRKEVEAKNIPISFWGKAVDQDDNPLEGVRVMMNVRQWQVQSARLLNPTGTFPKFEIETGPDGLFALTGVKGDVLTIESVAKDGYEPSAKAIRSYGYNVSTNFFPDPANPVVIRMWKKGEKQTLVSHQLRRVGIPCDGEPVFFDLLSGRKVPQEADLRISFRRDPLHLPAGTTNYDWTVEIATVRGGLKASDDEFLYLAPETGYEEKFVLTMRKEDEKWASKLDKQFYVRLRDGKYFGRLLLHLSTHYQPPPTGLSMDIAINPSGSRSLEK